jgi:hypothetical protein
MFTSRGSGPRADRQRRQAAHLLCLVVAIGACSLAGADGPKPTVLFDGKSLEGWKKTDFFKPGDVKVKDGTLVMDEGTPMTGITTTLKDLPRSNYELSYEAMRLTGSDFFAAATFPVGKSYITLVNGGWGGSVTGLSSLNGSDASENGSSSFVAYENKTWYRFRVQVTDEVIRCWVDDKPVVTVNYKDQLVSTRIETRANQPLGFATYESTGVLRKIEVRPLTQAEISANNKAS